MSLLPQSIQNYFGVIDTEKIHTICSLFRPQTIRKGEFFLHTGKACDRLSFVESGFLRIFVETEKKEITQWISGEGYFVTDLSSFIHGSPARWTIQALTDTEVMSISKATYQQIGSSLPEWPMLEKLFIVKCFTIMEERILGHLSMTAEERYQYFFENHRNLFNNVPLQYIASMLGMTPETFSRIRKKHAR
jgi:CRP-like cAMP-binding protein